MDEKIQQNETLRGNGSLEFKQRCRVKVQFDGWRPESTPEFIEQQSKYVNVAQMKQF